MKNPYPETRGHTLQRDCWQEGYDAKEKEDQDLYEASKAMYRSWVIRPDDEINVLIYKMAEQALARWEDK